VGFAPAKSHGVAGVEQVTLWAKDYFEGSLQHVDELNLAG
jgi:hypothetical protein